MTETQAREFLLKCRRFWFWRKEIGEYELINRIKAGCEVLTFFLLGLIGVLIANAINSNGILFYVAISLLIFSLAIIVFSIWVWFRIRKIIHILGKKL